MLQIFSANKKTYFNLICYSLPIPLGFYIAKVLQLVTHCLLDGFHSLADQSSLDELFVA